MDEARFTITLKGGPGYEAPWIVCRGNTADDAVAALRELYAADLHAKTRQMADIFRQGQVTTEQAVANVERAMPGSQVIGDSQQLPPAASGPTCPQCGGPTNYREGVSAKGKPYKALFCQNNSDHKPTWL